MVIQVRTARPENDQRRERCRELVARVPGLQVAATMTSKPPREVEATPEPCR